MYTVVSFVGITNDEAIVFLRFRDMIKDIIILHVIICRIGVE